MLLIISRSSVIVESTFLVLPHTLTNIYVLRTFYDVVEQYNWFSNEGMLKSEKKHSFC